jgi:Holliday junction resolvase RusA-like endonuclease
MIHIAIPGIPISTNHAYMTMVVGGGRKKIPKRVLTPEGRRYKVETSAYIVQHYPAELGVFRPNKPYGYIVQIAFSNLLNKGWPEKAKTRYKKLDASNRIKLLEDAMADAFGIDDSNFLSTRVDKVEGEENTLIWVWNMEEEAPY